MDDTPYATENADGTVTLHWRGPDSCLVSRELMEQMTDRENQLRALERAMRAHLAPIDEAKAASVEMIAAALKAGDRDRDLLANYYAQPVTLGDDARRGP